MRPLADQNSQGGSNAAFIDSLSSFSRLHRAQRWEGTFGDFLTNILPGNPAALARTSHEYIWDMLRWHGRAAVAEATETQRARELFKRELFGIDEPLARVVDYFKAAAAGSDVGRRLLLLLGPPSGGKSTLAILLKRGLEEYSRTDEGALYAIQRLAAAREPAQPHPDEPAGRSSASATASSISGRAVALGARLRGARVRGRFRARAGRARVPHRSLPLSASAPMRRTIRPPPTSPTWSARSTWPRWRRSAMRATRAPGPGPGAVYAASRGVLEMIEILKVKREFLYLLLTLTQEKNVKVSRFPLIHLDETILAHTNLAEFHKFLQEKENEALLDRMVIIKIPYALSYRDESRIYQKLVSGAPAFRNVHLDPHVLNLASVFAHSHPPGQARARGAGPGRRSCAFTPARRSRACRRPKPQRLHAESARGGPDRRQPALRHQRDLQRHHPRQYPQPHQHGAAARAQGRDRERCAHGCEAEEGLVRSPGDGAQGVLQPLGQGGRAPRDVRLLRGRGAAVAGEVSG